MNSYAALAERTDLIAIEAPPRPDSGALPPQQPRRHAQLEASSSNLTRFWELRGKRVVEVDGVAWGEYKGPFFSSLPFHLQLDLEPEEVRDIMRKNKIRGLRYPSANQPGLASGTYVCSPAGYGLQAVSRKQRNHVTEGLEACEMRDVDPAELLREGMALNRDTLRRHNRSVGMFLDPAQWQKFVDAVGRCPGMRIHGAYVNRRLSAYLISCREGEWLHLMYKMSRAEDMAQYPNHALDYSIVRDAEPGVKWVANGFVALTGNDGLDRYKRQLGYEVAKHNVSIHLHPTLAPFAVNGLTVSMAKAVSRAIPKNERIGYGAKILEGALASRFVKEDDPSPSDDMCQQEEATGFSRLRRPASAFPVLRVFQTLRKGGIKMTVRRATDFMRARAKRKAGVTTAKTPRPLSPDEVLSLQPGEWVQVKSLDEIRATLDAKMKNRGLLFTDDMRGYAGQRLRVFKRVESIFLEESKQRRTLKNTVLLETSYCPGITFRCDRSCFLFWKEAWVRRIPNDEQDQPTA